MALLKLLMFFIYVIASKFATVNPVNDIDRDIVDTIAGEQRIIGTWSLNGSSLAITVTNGNSDRLAAFIDGRSEKQTTVQFDRFLLKYNHSIMAASLVIPKVSRKDEGLYEIEETLYLTKPAPNDNFTERYMIQNGKWILELNVFETDEVQQGETGKSMAMEFEIVSRISTLYNYVKVCAIVGEQNCSISTQSHLHGRLSFTKDAFHNIYRITINNVTQRDAGLYKVSTDRDESMRRFLNITEKPTCSVVGDNLTIGWFFNQQGINRTLLVIHPNREVIMQLTPSNVPEIKSKFQHRLSYNGDVSRSFMILSLLNVRMSDAGLYTIETQHGNTIPGCKQVNVEASCTTTSRPPTGIRLLVPVYVIPVTIGIFALINLMVCFIIWIRRKKARNIETERQQIPATCDTDLHSTPIASERPLLIPLNEDVHMAQTNTSQNSHVDKNMEQLPMVNSLCMEGYEMICISSNDDFQNTLHNNQGNAGSHQSSPTSFRNTSGYLTVEFVMKSAVQNNQTV